MGRSRRVRGVGEPGHLPRACRSRRRPRHAPAGEAALRILGVRPRHALALLAAAASIAALEHLAAPHAGALERAAAPAFRVRALDGKTLELGKLLEQGPVLIDFWATWCKPCHAAIPELNAWHERYGAEGLTILGVSVDGPRNHGKVRPFVARMGMKYPVAIDQDGRVQQLYQVVAMPTVVLIDRDGTIAATRLGFRPGEGASLEQKIEALLARDRDEAKPEPESRTIPSDPDSTGEGDAAPPDSSTPRGP